MSTDPTPTPEVHPPAPAAPCRHLRNKGMYVYTDGSGSRHDDYDNTIYWCLKSMKGFGPDDEMVDRESCSDSSRSCYQPL